MWYVAIKNVSFDEVLSQEAKTLLNYILHYYINVRMSTHHLIHGTGLVWYKDAKLQIPFFGSGPKHPES